MKPACRYILLFLILIKNINLHGQQGNVWAFAYHAGLDFNFTPPKPITTGIKYPNVSFEADAFSSASISDCRGQLLFYGTGATVYNKKNKLMPHGLLNDGCGSQTVYIFPVPGDTNRYYYLYRNEGNCNEPSNAKDTGLYYSIIDMTLDSGKGDVDTNFKAIKIGKYNGGYTIAKNSNGRDYWLIRVQTNDSIYVYPITISGIRPPIKQKISPLAPGKFGLCDQMQSQR
jgi:hypothetical protein